MDEELIKYYRSFLKDSIRKVIDFSRTDQYRGIAPPPIEKPYPQNAKRVDLLPCDQFGEIGKIDLWSAIRNRESRRSYGDKPITLKELSFLLWATQGVKEKLDAGHALRVVPSAGCRHALETYLCVFNVAGLNPGVYRYLPLEHQLLFEFAGEHLKKRISDAVFGQTYPAEAAVTFIWTAVPYRMEWRYGLAAHKVIAIEAGHVCQNLYLACEAIGAGMCAMAAYDQEKMDEFLGVDGEDEFAIYLASVGRKEEA
ncbi:MAG TPA: SagB/ThcOx family dehydrogenase [Syntrophales bacterium]|jgi:SagB-type dehydrogenase family enzyme|nr:SagB/ThcOx family dehydrogenase [Syntrophales bacterium]HPX56862.1 SagB/ThcOx family dehydrogenase [Syntrophales bacterium]HQA82627.1 SagB/ThcOx family dehydrogenase [Syntrophales bacterium]